MGDFDRGPADLGFADMFYTVMKMQAWAYRKQILPYNGQKSYRKFIHCDQVMGEDSLAKASCHLDKRCQSLWIKVSLQILALDL